MTHEQIKEDLVLYAAGALDGADLAEVRAHLEHCAECRAEAAAMAADFESIRQAGAGALAPARSRARLMAAVKQEVSGQLVPFRTPKWVLVPIAACLLLAVALVVLFRNQRELEAEIAQTKSALTEAQLARAQAAGILEALRSPQAVRVTLSPVKAPIAQPRVDAVYSPNDKRLVVIASNLAPVATGKAYQLWLLPKSGAPIPAGTFRPDASGRAAYAMASFEPGAEAAGFAVTIEPEQGSATPTMPIVLVGKVG